MVTRIARPEPSEYGQFYTGYVKLTEGDLDVLEMLDRQMDAIRALERLSPAQANYRYEEGKWSVRQVIGHMADAERIFAYRLLRVARGDDTPLPGFDEKRFVAGANFDGRSAADLAEGLAVARQGTLSLVRGLDEASMTRRSVVNNHPITARALVHVTAGHLAHHLKVLRERYRVEP
jgi:uncharacterized damage-inducible protein DinB